MLSAAPGSPGLSSDNIQAWDVSLSDTKRGSQKIGACGELTCSRSPFLVSLNVSYGDVPCRLPTVLRIRTSYHHWRVNFIDNGQRPCIPALLLHAYRYYYHHYNFTNTARLYILLPLLPIY